MIVSKGLHMTTFDRRERGEEQKFANEQEQEFKAEARRNRMLGLWAGGLMELEFHTQALQMRLTIVALILSYGMFSTVILFMGHTMSGYYMPLYAKSHTA